MGVALAEAAARRGADVTLVAANVSLPVSPAGRGGPGRDRGRARRGRTCGVRHARTCVLMAAAVADFRPATAAEGKLAREGSGGMELRLDGDRGRDRRRWPTSAARIRPWSASPPSTARTRSPGRARSSSARASTRSSSTTSRAPRSASTRSATRSRSSSARASTRCRSRHKEEVAEAVLDEVDALRASRRRTTRKTRRMPDSTLHALSRGDGAARGRLLRRRPRCRSPRPRARRPEKTSVREALGRAYFRNRQFAEAATEFEAVVETHPVNDYAHFCLGRALTPDRRDEARPPSPGAGLEPAARASRLPPLPRPRRRAA